jgi:ABC-type branched-subunit amino acid transport system substrate-binding protein
VYTTGDPDGPTDTSIFQSTIGGCGIQPVYSTVFVDTTDESTGSFTNVISNLKLKNVTSVFCICQRTDVGNIQKEADNQSYFPEWMIPTYYYNDANYSYRTFGGPADQMSHVFGITVEPMQRQFQDHPSTWAYYGSEYFGDTGQAGNDTAYHSLLLIASGIQMAGPHLTPYTFQSGLQKANFPNPDSPLMAGKVGFNGGSHAMTLDAAEVWWSMTDQGPYPDETGGGVWCYGHHGARHNLSNPWPAADDLFKEPCDSGNEPANWTG